MKKYLMCKPDYFGVSYDINPYMTRNIGKVNLALAKSQWMELFKVISSFSAEMQILEGVPNCPDLVFTANAGLPTPRGFIISRFKFPERWPEEAHYKAWAEFYYKTAVSHPRAFFEGAGDCLKDSKGRYWQGHGRRSNDVSADITVHTGNCETLELRSGHFYHLDTCFAPLPSGHVVYYPGAFTIASRLKLIKTFGDKLISVSRKDALNFCCNLQPVTDDTIVVNSPSDTFIKQMKKIGYKVVGVNVSEFMKAGGGVKCLVLEI